MGRNSADSRVETPDTLASFANAPLVVAAIALSAAVAAVARFPNQPVPAPLIDRITDAQRAFEAAAGDFTVSLPSGGGAAYDDAWVKKALDDLDEGLKAKFEGIARQFADRDEARAAAARDMDDRFKALAQEIGDRLQALDGRTETLERGDRVADVELRVADIEKAAAAKPASKADKPGAEG